MNKRRHITVSVVAHVDHGKSTLCDSIIEECSDVILDHKSPTLDSHEIEKQRGVTIRNHFVKLEYKDISIDLLDTPGHYDFAQYVKAGIEISDIVLLVIDITKGIQPQTISYLKLAIEKNKKIFVLLNKVDLAEVHNNYMKEIKSVISNRFNLDSFIPVSAFKRINIDTILKEVYSYYQGNQSLNISSHISNMPLEFYVIDCINNIFYGTAILIKIHKGKIIKNSYITINKKKYKVLQVYTKCFDGSKEVDGYSNHVCYLKLNIDIHDCIKLIGKVIYSTGKLVKKIADPVYTTYASILSKDGTSFDKLKQAIIKININDPGVEYYFRYSKLYGNTYVLKFFGKFHKMVFLERLEKEQKVEFLECKFDIPYRYKSTKSEIEFDYHQNKVLLTNYKKYLQQLDTPFFDVDIYFQVDYYDGVYQYLVNKSHIEIKSKDFYDDHVIINAIIPMTYIAAQFDEDLKNITSGYVEIVIQDLIYKSVPLSMISFKINKSLIHELTSFEIYEIAKETANNQTDVVTKFLRRQQFKLVLNTLIDNKNISTLEIKPFRKDVAGKCQGGRDPSRKKKLLNKQKAGKSRLGGQGHIDQIKKDILAAFKV